MDGHYMDAPRDCSTPVEVEPTPSTILDTTEEDSVEIIFDSQEPMDDSNFSSDSEDSIPPVERWLQPNLSFVTGSPDPMELPDYTWDPDRATPTYGRDTPPSSPSPYAPTDVEEPMTAEPQPQYTFVGVMPFEQLAQSPNFNNLNYQIYINQFGHIVLWQNCNNNRF